MKSARGLLLVGALALAGSFGASCAQTSGAASGGTVVAPDASNATFKIEKDSITLVKGRSERPSAPGSATAAVTTLGDQTTSGDVDGDGRADTIVILVNQPGGSGTFYYVSALLNTASGVAATPAVMLGDRVKVDRVRLDGNTIVVDLLDRAPGQPMSTSPAVAVTKRFTVDAATLKAQ